MRFAKRLFQLRPEGAYLIMNQANQFEAQGKNIIHFEIGQPYTSTPANISLAAIQAITEGKTRYTPSMGIPELRHQIAVHVSQTHQVKVSPAEVAVTPSSKPTIFIAMAAILEPGDEVIYPDPGFPAYEILTQYFGCTPRPVPLTETSGFSFDLKAFRRTINPKTKLIILNSPSNPTGSVIPRRHLNLIAQLAQKFDCFVFSDEAYSRIIYDKKPYHSIYSLPRMKQRTILSDGFSKKFAMPGWRLGYMIFPQKIEQPMDYLMTHIFGCTAGFTQYAGIEGLTGDQTAIDLMVQELQHRRDLMIEGLNSIPGVHCHLPQGAFYAFPNVTAFGQTSLKLAQYILRRAGVALLAGTFFGPHGEGYLRLSYSTSKENIIEGLRRIKKILSKLPRS